MLAVTMPKQGNRHSRIVRDIAPAYCRNASVRFGRDWTWGQNIRARGSPEGKTPVTSPSRVHALRACCCQVYPGCVAVRRADLPGAALSTMRNRSIEFTDPHYVRRNNLPSRIRAAKLTG
jgi:hypothetical protein